MVDELCWATTLVCIHTSTHTYISMYVHDYTNMCLYILAHTYYVHEHTTVHAYTSILLHMLTLVHAYVYLSILVHAHMNTTSTLVQRYVPEQVACEHIPTQACACMCVHQHTHMCMNTLVSTCEHMASCALLCVFHTDMYTACEHAWTHGVCIYSTCTPACVYAHTCMYLGTMMHISTHRQQACANR